MNKPKTSYAFLMEMLWVCGFFALAACIFVLAFMKADQLSKDADSLNHAVLEAQNAVEAAYASHPLSLPSGIEEFSFDRNWNQTKLSGQEPAFFLRLVSSLEDGMLSVTATVTDTKDETIYSLHSAKYLPPERSRS